MKNIDFRCSVFSYENSKWCAGAGNLERAPQRPSGRRLVKPPHRSLERSEWREIKNGAVNQNNLEPAPLVSILDELEEWARYLNAEPEVIHKLQAFEKAADVAESNSPDMQTRPSRPQGPSL